MVDKGMIKIAASRGRKGSGSGGSRAGSSIMDKAILNTNVKFSEDMRITENVVVGSGEINPIANQTVVGKSTFNALNITQGSSLNPT